MSDRINMDFIDCKRIKLEDRCEKLSCFDATCRNSVVDCFKNKCINFFRKQLNDKSIRSYNSFTNTGKKSKTIKIINYDHLLFSFSKFC